MHAPPTRVKLEDRLLELREAVQTLDTLPHAAVYMDAGAADAVSVSRTASLLRRADVAQAQGFFVNSTHFDWTTEELAYGQAISAKLGGAHFVVNTGENGQGPLAPTSRKDSATRSCATHPARPRPACRTHSRLPLFTTRGGSAGEPRLRPRRPATPFGPPPQRGVRHADFHITGPGERLLRDGTYAPYDAAVAPDRSHSRLTHFNRQH